MKKILFAIALVVSSLAAKAQNGLEQVIVEKYYVSNSADSVGSVGILPIGSTTYRIYADLLPGYNFQALYGVAGHDLKVETSTKFFNNEDFGATSPNGFSATNIRKNTVMLDSWFSVGSAGNGKVGVLKTEDTDGSVGNANGILANTAFPINGTGASDGMIAGTAPSVTFVGINNTGATDLGQFDATSQLGGSFITSNGSIASLGGSTGSTATNRVLIGQFTTNGVFTFELNIQVGTPGGSTQNFVARNPVGSEITIPSLIGTFGLPNALPTVSITSPANGASFLTGAVVPINATAADADGTISFVEFLVDGTVISTDNSAPYSANYTSTQGNHTLTARATDNNGGVTTSSAVNIIVRSNGAPSVSITNPASGSLFTAPAPVTINATASDADGSVVRVEFYVNGVMVGSDNSSPYSFVWTSVIGSAALTAKAIDNDSSFSISSAVNIDILDPNALPYKIGNLTLNCSNSSFCIPIIANDSVRNVIGYDILVNYNKNKVSPTGAVTVSNNLINPALVDVITTLDTAAGTVGLSLFFNSSAPASAAFSGVGQLACVEFVKNQSFNFNDTAQFSIASLRESRYTGVVTKLGDPGRFVSFKDSTYTAELRFWGNNAPLAYNSASPAQFLETKIFGQNSTCGSRSVGFVNPNLNGQFSHSLNNGLDIEIIRDINGSTSVQSVVNGFDAFLSRKVISADRSFIPNVYQMIAMDVNIDGVISAGDISQINQRAVLIIPEFRQAWNYSAAGVSNGQPSKDWLFINSSTARSNTSYQISSTYPADNGIGFSRFRVPVTPFCLPTSVTNVGTCPEIISGDIFTGVLLGDINGNFATIGSTGVYRSDNSNQVVIDLAAAVATNDYMEIPILFNSSQDIYSLDFSFSLSGSNIQIVDVRTISPDVQAMYNIVDNTVRFTSYSMDKINSSSPVAVIRVRSNNAVLSTSDILNSEAYLNGDPVGLSFTKEVATTAANQNIRIYPNPAANHLNVEVQADATLQILDLTGRQILISENLTAGVAHTINLSILSNGMYSVKIFNSEFTTTKKVVVQH